MKNLEAQADVVKGNIVIYGKLTPMTYAVNYEANAGTDATVNGIPAAQTKTHGEVLTLANNTPTREGYTFKGWATSPTGPVAYQPGGQYLNDAPVTLYAVWEKRTYTVTISSGSGRRSFWPVSPPWGSSARSRAASTCARVTLPATASTILSGV